MSFYNTKCTLKLTLLSVWFIVVCTVYCEILIHHKRSSLQHNYYNEYTERMFVPFFIKKDTIGFLIDLPGCSIPDYSKTYKVEEANDLRQTCGSRAIDIKKINDSIIIFTIYDTIRHYTKRKYSCCYQFISPTKVKGKLDVRVLSYTPCAPFKNGTKTYLKQEIIFVTCKVTVCTKQNKSKNLVFYTDVYAFIKKTNTLKQINKKKWNILILGMDTMSRARLYSSMPKTARHIKKYKWLDYSAFQKVGLNTFPNVMSLLTGKKMSTIYKSCSAGMDRCNDMIIWSDFKKNGYITATGEDYLNLPDMFSKYGYVSPPTDHYLRPLFKTGEQHVGNQVCTQKKSSVKHVLDYAIDFANTYKNQKFLGMFWTNSYSHNLNHIPRLIDGDITNLFKKLYISGVFKNTFVFLVSDHGLRSGKMREVSYESYYEERLPMLFLRVPEKFRRMYVKSFKNMKANQKRLITPYDLYLTFENILGKTNITSEACPTCVSIFKEISPFRTCADAGVDEKWCTCRKLTSIIETDSDVTFSLKLAERHLQNRIKNVKTIPCMLCADLNIKSVLRTHTYHDPLKNTTFYVVAFKTTPGNIAFEAVTSKYKENITMLSTETISAYNTRGSCVLNPSDRGYCYCKFICYK